MRHYLNLLSAALMVACLTACGTGNDPLLNMEYVDMGEAGKWATMNLGAKVPSGVGFYFAWGETGDKETYDWENYDYCKGNDLTGITKYTINDFTTGAAWYSNGSFSGDNITVLQTGDDAATQFLGKNWRMPTYEEWMKLTDTYLYDWSWGSNGGVPGCWVTSKLEGTKGNRIFFPLTGYMQNNTVSFLTTGGFYWSSTVGIEGGYDLYYHESATSQAWAGYLTQDARDLLQIPRCNGLPIRAVRK